MKRRIKWLILNVCFFFSVIGNMKKQYHDHEDDHVDQKVTCSKHSSRWLYFLCWFGHRGRFLHSIGMQLERQTFRMKWVSHCMLDPLNHFIECQLNPIKFISKPSIQTICYCFCTEKKLCTENFTIPDPIFRFTDSDFLTLKEIYANDTKMQSIIDNYDEKDIAAVLFDSHSTSLWTITPPNLQRFKNELNGNGTIKFRFIISVSRRTYNQNSDRVEKTQEIYLTADNPARKELLSAINKKNPNRYVHLVNLFPKFIKVWNDSWCQASIHCCKRTFHFIFSFVRTLLERMNSFFVLFHCCMKHNKA